jgi:hypothetical protein
MKRLISAVIIISALLIATTVIINILYAYYLSISHYLLFRVQMNQNLGYSFFNYTPIRQGSLLMNVQYAGFAVLLSGLLWASRHKLYGLLKPVKHASADC